ncbi:MFS transporter [Teichococcus vastitatis]|uniref:MFS transporter n=1 Tax=Teichococcus vastitatis TaxID=2307076 RepID=A0ABS9W383_9PROT|nr:MFS transporter [Pseudoroseomonas vastitatis]
MAPCRHLVLITFFTGNIQGGLGSFLAIWLAQTRNWGPEPIGWLNTLVGLGGLALSGPAGALVDRLKLPRLLLALACGAILAGTMLLLVSHGFLGVLAAHGLATIGGILVLPAVTAFTLGIVGKKDFPRQHGRNEAFNHAGIQFSALMIVGGATLLGPDVSLFVMAAMALGAILAVAAAPGKAWSAARATGEDDGDAEAGGQLSHVVGGTLVAWIGWPAAFLALALPVGGGCCCASASAGASGAPKGRAAKPSPLDGGRRATGSKPRHVRAISPAPAETAPRRVSPCRTLMPPPWATTSRP